MEVTIGTDPLSVLAKEAEESEPPKKPPPPPLFTSSSDLSLSSTAAGLNFVDSSNEAVKPIAGSGRSSPKDPPPPNRSDVSASADPQR